MFRKSLAAIGLVAAMASFSGGCAGPAPDSPVAAAPQAAQPTARLTYGVVAGAVVGPAAVYRGIPYAAPPMGPLRWKPPQAPARWTGIRQATARTPACPQPILPGGIPNGGGYTGPTSEDCLTINVTAPLVPAPVGARGAPVMVWIPGGGNTSGGAEVESYDARNFARDGVILVTFNYRLGPLGFMAHPALTAEAPAGQPLGNYGLMDQVAVLRWVKANIRAFGGDPGNVTLFGESAGGADTLALMTTPAARGLFHKAIVESGGGWWQADTLAQREADGAALAAKLGLPAGATPDQLRAIPVEALIANLGRGDVGPTVDGRMFSLSPTQAFAQGRAVDVPLIIGSNSNEASIAGNFAGPAGAAAAAAIPAEVRAAYPGLSDNELARQHFNDARFGGPARWIAARAAAGRPSWLYYFSYVPERQRGTRPGTNHASEIPFFFDSIGAIPGRMALAQASERNLTALAHACWVAFARTSVPACPNTPWPAYDPATDQLLHFDEVTVLETFFRKPQLDAVEKVETSIRP